jgi:hypothetical protein
MKWWSIGLALFLIAAGPAAGKASLSTPQVEIDGNQIRVDFELRDAFEEAVVERIESGLPTGFDFKLKLVRPRSWWFDNSLGSIDLQVVAMYNAVSREYLVNFKQDGKLTGSRVVHDLEELERAMTRFEDLPVFTVDPERAGRRVRVRMRAILGSHNILAFIPTKTHTEWVESQPFTLP